MLVLLAAGKVVYFGDTTDAVKYFSTSKFGFEYHETQNPADFVIAVAGSFVKDKGGNTVTADMLVKHYEEVGGRAKQSSLGPKATSDVATKVVGLYPTSFFKQYMVMFKRQGLKTLRNKLPIQISVFRYKYFSILLYIFYIVNMTNTSISEDAFWLLYFSDPFSRTYPKEEVTTRTNRVSGFAFSACFTILWCRYRRYRCTSTIECFTIASVEQKFTDLFLTGLQFGQFGLYF